MIVVFLTEEEREAVRQRVELAWVNNSKSIAPNVYKRNLAGFTGEAMFHHQFPDAVPVRNSFLHDFMLGDKRIEVKSRASDGKPRPYWDCKIPKYSVEFQDCSAYVFTITRTDGSGGYLLGGLTHDEFVEKAREVRAASLLDGYVQNKIVDASLLVVQISDLHRLLGDEEE